MTLVKRNRKASKERPPPPPSPASGTGTPTDEDELEDYIVRRFPYLFERLHKDSRRRWLASKRFLIPITALLTLLLVVVFLPFDPWIILEQAGVPHLPELELARFFAELGKMRAALPSMDQFSGVEGFVVGSQLAQEGYKATYPVVIVPGIISTGLESWSTKPEHRTYFRQKIWGGMSMVGHVLSDREKWMATLMLDPETGLDPRNGAKLRAVQGIDAASSFIQGYWIWSKVIENLAAINYDTNNLWLAAYDWRVSLWNLEERDGYFSKLKSTIESFKKLEGRKTVMVAHSMGSTVLKWVEAEGPKFGNGGPSWVDDHIESFVSVAGTHLPKAMTAFLSGEMKDTVEINPAGAYILDRFFSKKDRAKLFRSWAGSASMWLKGGSAIWGNVTHAPDDPDGCEHTGLSHGQFVSFRPHPDGAEAMEPGLGNMTVDEVSAWVLEHTPQAYQRMVASNYSYGIERDDERLKANDRDHTKWSNPLEIRLPNAPSMKLVCVYGHGKETERSYWYARGSYEYDEAGIADAPDATCAVDSECTSSRPPLDMPLARRSWIDVGISDERPETPIKIRNGVKFGEGDGTVSLLSLGAMCAEGWRRPRWNPGGIKVVSYELPHQPNYNLRGGAQTADHVDVLGSTPLNELILKVAAGHAEEIQDRFVSSVREYAKRMQWDV
ncbi:LACT-domain-containing protein [Exidia glandulosa HHB12029]|uniref:LACT-domain-containing protein n=1 Tax=Exidia glandulosa HHB12029 TaxID=1314781 RepID=A0A165CPY7_EXIGL|nr:LACT-domain-containing protein [Exidia glandulosa HHB12029]